MAGKKFHRSSTDKVLGGVAGGMAEYFDIDSPLVRILWVVVVLSGVGLLAYILLWMLAPLE